MKTQDEHINDPASCPNCTSNGLEWAFIEIRDVDDSPHAFQEVTCLDCGFEWEDKYKLIGYMEESENESTNN